MTTNELLLIKSRVDDLYIKFDKLQAEVANRDTAQGMLLEKINGNLEKLVDKLSRHVDWEEALYEGKEYGHKRTD